MMLAQDIILRFRDSVTELQSYCIIITPLKIKFTKLNKIFCTFAVRMIKTVSFV